MNEELLSQINTLLQNASPEVRHLVLSGNIDHSVIELTNKYRLTVTEALTVKNTIILTLLGMIPTNEVDETLAKELTLEPGEREKLLKDIDEGVFEQARITLFGKEYEKGHEVRKIVIGEEETKDELREQILAHTDRDSAVKTSPVAPPSVSPTTEPLKEVTSSLPASRSDLLERMSILDAIPKDEEIEERLTKIRSQFQTQEEEEKIQEASIPEAVPVPLPEKKKVTFPEHYNVDPYRETAEE